MRSHGAVMAMSALLALAIAGCGSGASLGSQQPRDARAGIQVAGTLNGAQFSLSDGDPRVLIGDCDPNDGRDNDICAVANDLTGAQFVLVFENPSALTQGETVPVVDVACAPQACDTVRDGAVVDVQTGASGRIRATGGSVEFEVIEPLLRYRGTARLELPDGNLSATFDLVPGSDS